MFSGLPFSDPDEARDAVRLGLESLQLDGYKKEDLEEFVLSEIALLYEE